jgi:hypothetical protein
MKLLLAAMLSIGTVGCAASHQRVRFVEAPDPIVGDLRCMAPKLTIIEALYFAPEAGPRPTQCQTSGT